MQGKSNKLEQTMKQLDFHIRKRVLIKGLCVTFLFNILSTSHRENTGARWLQLESDCRENIYQPQICQIFSTLPAESKEIKRALLMQKVKKEREIEKKLTCFKTIKAQHSKKKITSICMFGRTLVRMWKQSRWDIEDMVSGSGREFRLGNMPLPMKIPY